MFKARDLMDASYYSTLNSNKKRHHEGDVFYWLPLFDEIITKSYEDVLCFYPLVNLIRF